MNAVGAVKVSMDGISDFFSTGAGSGACGMTDFVTIPPLSSVGAVIAPFEFDEIWVWTLSGTGIVDFGTRKSGCGNAFGCLKGFGATGMIDLATLSR